jgi:microcystin-dependent protein
VARCGCASDQCACTVVAGENVSVSGTGSQNNPYVVSAATEVIVEGGGGGGTPTVERLPGEMVMYGGAAAPTGWLICDGTPVNRSVYAALYAVLGTSYGAGDGETTFNLPNLSGKVPYGVDGSNARGATGGANTKTLLTANLPAHTHTANHTHTMDVQGSHDHGLDRSTATGGSNVTIPQGSGTISGTTHGAIEDDGLHSHTINAANITTSSVGSGTAFDNRSAYQAVNYIVKT